MRVAFGSDEWTPLTDAVRVDLEVRGHVVVAAPDGPAGTVTAPATMRPAPTENVPSGTSAMTRPSADVGPATSRAPSAFGGSSGAGSCGPEGTWGVDTVSSRPLPSEPHSRPRDLGSSPTADKPTVDKLG